MTASTATSPMGELIEIVEIMAKSLVDIPEAVRAASVEKEGKTIIELHVDPTDVGKVIGKEGRTAQSMRTIVSAAANRLRISVALEIED